MMATENENYMLLNNANLMRDTSSQNGGPESVLVFQPNYFQIKI